MLHVPERPLSKDVMFGIAYLIEILVRIVGTKRSFFCDATNWFDTSLVVLWLADLFLSQHMPLDSGMVRSLVNSFSKLVHAWYPPLSR